MGRFRHGRGGRFLTAPEKTRQISKIRQIFYDNQGTLLFMIENTRYRAALRRNPETGDWYRTTANNSSNNAEKNKRTQDEHYSFFGIGDRRHKPERCSKRNNYDEIRTMYSLCGGIIGCRCGYIGVIFPATDSTGQRHNAAGFGMGIGLTADTRRRNQ